MYFIRNDYITYIFEEKSGNLETECDIYVFKFVSLKDPANSDLKMISVAMV